MSLKTISRAFGIFLMMITACSINVCASDSMENNLQQDIGRVLVAEESDNLGRIIIMLEDTEYLRPKENVVFGVTKVADVENGEFVLEDPYADLGIDLNTLETANEMEETCKVLQPLVSKEFEAVTDKDGVAVIKNVPVGVYFIYAIDIADYEYITSFLVSVPTWNETDKVMNYDVVSIPKHTKIIGNITTDIPDDFSEGVMTGDLSNYFMWMRIAAMSLILILSISFCKLYKRTKY